MRFGCDYRISCIRKTDSNNSLILEYCDDGNVSLVKSDYDGFIEEYDGGVISFRRGKMNEDSRRLVETFYADSGKIWEIYTENEKGESDGIREEWGKNGILASHTYVDGELCGPFFECYESGNIKMKGNYGKDGKIDAIERFHENEEIKIASAQKLI